jgi:DNA-binding Lrp family transcriptional regulator
LDNKDRFSKVDEKDIKIIGLLASGYNDQQISTKLQIPLSTLQRRVRQILEKGLLQPYFKPNYKQLGLKKGIIYVYLKEDNLTPVGEKIFTMDGITSVSIHFGNSNVVALADFVYKDREELVDRLSAIKKLEGIDTAVWIEEAFVFPVNGENITSLYEKLIRGS